MSEDHASDMPQSKKQRLLCNESLLEMCPLQLQQTVMQFAKINEEKLCITCRTSSRDDIHFKITYGCNPNALGTVKGKFEEEYGRDVSITAPLFGDHKPSLSELGYFEVGDYDHEEAVIYQMIKKAVVAVINYIFLDQTNVCDALNIDHYIIDSLKIDMHELNGKYDIYRLNNKRNADFLFLRQPELCQDFFCQDVVSSKPYIYPCTVLLRKKRDSIFREVDLQKSNGVDEDQVDYLMSYLCRIREVNYEFFPSAIVDQIHRYQAKGPENVLKFERKCAIVQTRDGGIEIYFDFPIMITSNDWRNLHFKLRINGIVITGKKFYFDRSKDDGQFKIGNYWNPFFRYSYPDRRCQSHICFCIHLRSRENLDDILDQKASGYQVFENKIKKNSFSIMDVSTHFKLMEEADNIIDAAHSHSSESSRL